MQKINYYFFRILIFLFSLMPFWLMYRLSDFLYFLFYYFIKYRYKVIQGNLQKAFPQKSTVEIKQLTKGVYRNFCDILLEGIKGISMSPKEFEKRFRYINIELLYDHYENGKSIIAAGSHYANWEWGVLSIQDLSKHQTFGIYKPIKNKYMDSYFKSSRASSGMKLVSMFDTQKALKRVKNQLSIFILVTDQNPSNLQKAYWVKFFNQDTACLHGLDNISRDTNYALVYVEVERVKRGYYEVHLSNLHTNPKDAPPGTITQLYMNALEKTIRKKPENWLWSHRRWKHKKIN